MLLIGSILVLAAGLVMLISPGTIYELTESWKSYSSGEPSTLYLISTRIGGALSALVGIAGIVVFFLF